MASLSQPRPRQRARHRHSDRSVSSFSSICHSGFSLRGKTGEDFVGTKVLAVHFAPVGQSFDKQVFDVDHFVVIVHRGCRPLENDPEVHSQKARQNSLMIGSGRPSPSMRRPVRVNSVLYLPFVVEWSSSELIRLCRHPSIRTLCGAMIRSVPVGRSRFSRRCYL